MCFTDVSELIEIIIIIIIITHADDSRVSKAFTDVCVCASVTVCVSVCLFVRSITQKHFLRLM